MSRLALKRLVKLSKGQFSQEMVDQLVARAAAGDVPSGTPSAEAPEAARRLVARLSSTSRSSASLARSTWICPSPHAATILEPSG